MTLRRSPRQAHDLGTDAAGPAAGGDWAAAAWPAVPPSLRELAEAGGGAGPELSRVVEFPAQVGDVTGEMGTGPREWLRGRGWSTVGRSKAQEGVYGLEVLQVGPSL